MYNYDKIGKEKASREREFAKPLTKIVGKTHKSLYVYYKICTCTQKGMPSMYMVMMLLMQEHSHLTLNGDIDYNPPNHTEQ